MAKVQNPITGRTSGSLANATFSTWKGLNVMKSKALEVANPNTGDQRSTRNAFKIAVQYGRPLLSLIRIGFKELAVKKTEWNVFIKEAMKAITLSGAGLYTVDYTKLMFSKGSISTIANAAATGVTSNTAGFTWDNNSNGSTALSTDVIYAVAVDEITGQTEVSLNTATRGATSQTFNFNEVSLGGLAFHLYLAIARPTTGQAGDSVFVQ